MKMQHIGALCIGLVTTGFLPQVQAAYWDATADFTAATRSNPNGVWSYGYDPAALPGYQFKAFDLFTNAGTWPIWNDSTYIASGTPSFAKNLSGTYLHGVVSGQIVLHPGPTPDGDAAILRFTAPATARYDVHSQFFVGDLGETDAWVAYNRSLLPLGVTSANPRFDATLYLQAGDTLDFVVGNHGSYYGDTTPLTVSIASAVSAVPEPNSIWAAGLGCAGLWLRLRRRQVGRSLLSS